MPTSCWTTSRTSTGSLRRRHACASHEPHVFVLCDSLGTLTLPLAASLPHSAGVRSAPSCSTLNGLGALGASPNSCLSMPIRASTLPHPALLPPARAPPTQAVRTKKELLRCKEELMRLRVAESNSADSSTLERLRRTVNLVRWNWGLTH